MFRGSEEEAAPVSDRTMDGVHESKFEDSWEEDPQQDNIDQKVYKSVTFDVASGQPPNKVQTMRMQQLQDAVHQQNVQSYHSPAPMRAQPQPETQSSITESDPMKRQVTEVLTKKLKQVLQCRKNATAPV